EFHYVQRGAKWDLAQVSGGSGHVVHTLKLDYVEIPLLLRVTSQSSASIRPFGVLGPVFGIRASSKADLSGSGISDSGDISDVMKGAYWGGLFGGGLRVRTSERSALLFQARYQLGFSNLFNSPTVSMKPQDFAFLAGYSKGL